jgi:hypothetical protein
MPTKAKRHSKTRTKVAKLSGPQAALLRLIPAPVPEGEDGPRFHKWDLPKGVQAATLHALVRLGYVAEEADPEDSLMAVYALSAKGTGLVEAERRAEHLAATKGERAKAKELADALLLANQLDGRAELNGVYPANGIAGLYEVDYYDTLSAGRFVVVVDTIAGTADLQRQ